MGKNKQLRTVGLLTLACIFLLARSFHHQASKLATFADVAKLTLDIETAAENLGGLPFRPQTELQSVELFAVENCGKPDAVFAAAYERWKNVGHLTNPSSMPLSELTQRLRTAPPEVIAFSACAYPLIASFREDAEFSIYWKEHYRLFRQGGGYRVFVRQFKTE